MLVLAGHPGPQPWYEGGGLEGVDHGHEDVARVDGRRPTHPGGAQGDRIVQAGPLVPGQEVGHLQPGGQQGVLSQVGVADVLAGEQGGVVVELCREGALSGPGADPAVGPAGLVDDGVQRVAGAEGQHPGQVVAEACRGGVGLQEVVQGVHAAAGTQADADAAQALGTHRVPARGEDLPAPSSLHEGGHTVPVSGVAVVVLLAPDPHGLVGQGVDLLDAVPDGGQAPGEVGLLQAGGVG